jgi:hypothetical protein
MRRKSTLAGVVALILCCIAYLQLHDKGTETDTPERKPALQEHERAPEQEDAPAQAETAQARTGAEASGTEDPNEDLHTRASPSEAEERQPETVYHPEDVEEIKKQIYDREIEYIDQIYLLDDLVQTGDADTREFWGHNWSSVDDWKSVDNGFSLTKLDDETLVFSPDEETTRLYSFFESLQLYTYDEQRREFVNEVDYYGKKIRNVAKFINEDVLVMMTISGRKVDLNIYQKGAAEE